MTPSMSPFRIGLVVNPLAGLGGQVGLKGSDGAAIQALAIEKGAQPRAQDRVKAVLSQFSAAPEIQRPVEWLTVSGAMGADLLMTLGYDPIIAFHLESGRASTADDTRAAVAALCGAGVDLMVFAGGDGTARDVLDSLPNGQLVLGVPCGVKMYSGVFAVNPEAASRVLRSLVQADRVSCQSAEVRDIDEAAYRAGQISARYYGEMSVPVAHQYVQATKIGGRESEPLAQEEIAAGYVENMLEDVTYLFGAGRTVGTVMAHLALPHSLLGVDVVKNGTLLAADAGAETLIDFARQGAVKLVVGVTGGHGFLFGRGNQQLSPDLIRLIGKENIDILATRTKLAQLPLGWLLLDTGDADLDRSLAGLYRVRSGFDDFLLVQVGEAS